MTKFKLFHLKNEMLIANGLANFIGVFFANATMFMAEGFPDKQMWQQGFAYWVDMLFTPFAFSFVAVMTLLYEKPIRRYLNLSFKQASISQGLETSARRRLLNAPFVLIALSFSMWLLAAIIYPLLHWAHDSGSNMVQRALTNALSSGIITVTVAFFLLEHILQKKLAPHFLNQNPPGCPPVCLQPDSACFHYAGSAQNHNNSGRFKYSDTAITFSHIYQCHHFFKRRRFSDHPAGEEFIDSL
jgi:hypothetical protein